MSRLYIKELEVLGQTRNITATDWEVYSSTKMTPESLLFKSEKDTENLMEIHFVPKLPNGKLYEPSDGMYARIRVWIEDRASGWYTVMNTCKDTTETENDVVHILEVAKNITSIADGPVIVDVKGN